MSALDAATRDAQARASDPGRSAWVSANAGAGKTHVLTSRVARLLLAGHAPSRILCLTYTKAAAAEMLDRLFRTLAGWATAPQAELEAGLAKLTGRTPDAALMRTARQLFARTLDAPEGLRIQTIHSFCQDLLARFPLESGLAPGFEVLDERAAADLVRAARHRLFQRMARGDGDLPNLGARLTARFDEWSLGGLLSELRSARGDFRAMTGHERGLAGALAALRAHLGVADGVSEDTLLEEAFTGPGFPQAELTGVVQALAAGTVSDQKAADCMAPLLETGDWRRHLADYRRAFFTTNGDPRARLVTAATAKRLPEAPEIMARELARLEDLDRRCRSARLAAATETALSFGDRFLSAYEALKAEQGRLDYDDLILKAGALLGRLDMASWVLYKLDQDIEHILVDEAQDTSPGAWEVISLLTQEFFAGAGADGANRHTVFAVGDDKQSIYGFQGARPELFDAKEREYGALAEAAQRPWEQVTLDLSFRSLPAILRCVDAVFANEAAARGLSSRPGPIAHRALRDDGAGLVELWPVVKPEKPEDSEAWDAPLDRPPSNNPRAMLARRIADQVEGWFANGETLPDKDYPEGRRPIRPGDILILVRRRDALVDEMIRAFRERSIPVAGTDRLRLTEHIAVMDLMAAADVALLPQDDLSLAALLKSPLADLDEETLFALAHGRDGSLWDALRARRGECEALARAAALVERLIAASGLRPFEFFSRLLIEDGGFGAMLARLGPDAADPLTEFCSQALAFERTHVPDLQGFLGWLRADVIEIKRDMDQAADEIRIMTVHGAKGLQAGVVILPDTCAVPPATHDPSLLPLQGVPGLDACLVYAPGKTHDSPESAAARAAFREKQDAEQRRLLYVALTRARDRLYICGHEPATRGRPPGCWYDLVEAGLAPIAAPVESGFGAPALRLGEKPPPLQAAADGAPAAAVPDWADRTPAAENGPRHAAPSRLGGGAQPDSGGARDPAAVARGLLIHKLLEVLPALPAGDREAAARRCLDTNATALSAEERAALAAETLAVLDDERFAAVFGPGSRAEAPIAGTCPELGPGVVVEGQIDRLLVTDQRILIVDFKTGTPPAGPVADHAPHYVRQMAAYRALLRRIYPGREVACGLLWTRIPALTAIAPEVLEAAFSAVSADTAPP